MSDNMSTEHLSLRKELRSYNRREMMKQILQLADNIGCSSVCAIRRSIASGQGMPTYNETLAAGATRLRRMVNTLVGEHEIPDELFVCLFEVGFDKAVAKTDDPYAPMTFHIDEIMDDAAGED